MWKGSFVALVTPFLEDGSVDMAAFDRLIVMHLESGTQGMVLLGSTGEAALLGEGEKEALIQRAATLISGALPLVVGISSPSTAKSLAFGEKALYLGANALMATPPYYVKPDWRGVQAHFEALNTLQAPLIVYNHPGRTGITLTQENLLELSALTHVVAIKESGGGSAVCATVPLLCGDDPLVERMMAEGSAGSVSVIANAYPREWRAFVARGSACPFNELLEALGTAPNPVGIKFVMSQLGLCQPTVRLPLVPLTSEQKGLIEMRLNALQK